MKFVFSFLSLFFLINQAQGRDIFKVSFEKNSTNNIETVVFISKQLNRKFGVPMNWIKVDEVATCEQINSNESMAVFCLTKTRKLKTIKRPSERLTKICDQIKKISSKGWLE